MWKFLTFLITTLLLTFSANGARTYRSSPKVIAGYQAGTGSYNIPSDRYGVVRVNCKAGESFTIAGTTVLSSNNNTYTVLSGSPLTASNPYAGVTALQTHSGNTPAGSAFSANTATNNTNVAQTYVVPSGVAINGCRYYVELYRD